jgi:hypothetical protein
MQKEWIDVADTAIKIGLSSLITGAFTYLGIKLSYKSNNKRFMLEHEVKLLEIISSEIEEYFGALDSYIGQVSGIAKRKLAIGTTEDPLNEGQKELISIRNNTLVEAWDKRETAIAKLRLLKAEDTANSLYEFKTLEKELRDPILFDDVFPDYSTIAIIREKNKNLKSKVREELSNFYAKYKH